MENHKSDETLAAWLDCVNPVWETVLPKEAARKVLAVDASTGGALDDVADELGDSLASSQLGN
eukprot:6150823-Amphidinium_carterae.2